MGRNKIIREEGTRRWNFTFIATEEEFKQIVNYLPRSIEERLPVVNAMFDNHVEIPGELVVRGSGRGRPKVVKPEGAKQRCVLVWGDEEEYQTLLEKSGKNGRRRTLVMLNGSVQKGEVNHVDSTEGN